MDMEERVTKLEIENKDTKARLDRHSTRLLNLEQNQTQDAVRLATMETKVDDLDSKVDILTEGQKQTNKRLAVIENNNDANFNKVFIFLRALAILTVVTLVVVTCKDTSTATSIVKTAVPLVTGVVA